MSVLVVGLSHKSAPVATLERAAVSGDAHPGPVNGLPTAGSRPPVTSELAAQA